MALMKNPHAVALGRLGGRARAKRLAPEQKREIAKRAGQARQAALSPGERRRLAMLGVRARRQKVRTPKS